MVWDLSAERFRVDSAPVIVRILVSTGVEAVKELVLHCPRRTNMITRLCDHQQIESVYAIGPPGNQDHEFSG